MTGFDDKGTFENLTRTEDVPHFHGHRDRLKARFRDTGSETFPDYELLELILFQVVPRKDTKPLAKALLTRFGSFSEVLSAPETLLLEVSGVGEAVAHHLKVVQAAALRYARDRRAPARLSIHGRRSSTIAARRWPTRRSSSSASCFSTSATS
jgi:DNA repair protein RadC